MQVKKIRDWKIENKVFLIAFIFSFFGLIIFLSLINVNKWLWSGWLFGVTSIFIGHLISILLIKIFFRKKRTKLNGFFSGIGRTLTNYFIQVGLFFALIAINSLYNKSPFLNGGIEILINGPIIIFTYLGGISVFAFASFFSIFIKKKVGVSETICR